MVNYTDKEMSKIAVRVLNRFNTINERKSIRYTLHGNRPAHTWISGQLNLDFMIVGRVMTALQYHGLLHSYKAGEASFVDVTGYGLTDKGKELVQNSSEEKLLEIIEEKLSQVDVSSFLHAAPYQTV